MGDIHHAPFGPTCAPSEVTQISRRARLKAAVCFRGLSVCGSVLALAAWAGSASAEPTLALVTHPVVNVPEEESTRLASDIAQVLAKRYSARVLAGADVNSKLPKDLPDDCVAQSSCTRDLGKKLGADQLLFLVMVRVGNKVQIDSTWVDVGVDRSSTRDPISLEPDPTRRQEVLRETAPSLIPRGALVARWDRPDAAGGNLDQTEMSQRVDRTGRDRGDVVDAWAVDRSAKKGHVSAGVWIAGGVSAAALVTGVAMIIGARTDYNNMIELNCATNSRPCELDGSLGRYGTMSAVSSFLLTGAALAAATALGLYASDAAEEGGP